MVVCAWGFMKVWVSDGASLFNNRVIRKVAAALQVVHRFGAANSAWTNGTVRTLIREILKSMGEILSEGGKTLSEWTTVVPAVQWALNIAWRLPLKMVPLVARSGRASSTVFAVLSEDEEGIEVEPRDPGTIQEYFRGLVTAEEEKQRGGGREGKEVTARKEQSRRKS